MGQDGKDASNVSISVFVIVFYKKRKQFQRGIVIVANDISLHMVYLDDYSVHLWANIILILDYSMGVLWNLLKGGGEKMSFLNTLGKIAKFSGEVFIEATNEHIDKIDRMSDDEIEKRYHKPADEVRNSADTYHLCTEQAQMRKAHVEMERMRREKEREHWRAENEHRKAEQAQRDE